MTSISVRQGDYLPKVGVLYAGSASGSTQHPTELGVVLISQCCDLAKMSSTNLPVCAAVTYLGGDAAALARSGRQPRYASVEHFGEGLFIDFGLVGTLEPDFIGQVVRETDEQRRRILAGRIARRFSRFAYPDLIQPSLASLQKLLRSRVAKESPVARCLEQLATLRVEAEWDEGPPWAMNLVFVLNDGILAPIGDDSPEAALLRVMPVDIDRTAQAIDACAAEDPQLLPLWERFAELVCERALAEAVPTVIREWTVEVTDETDFSYSRFVRSVDIDVDDLSETE
jgi:hypothetical protein